MATVEQRYQAATDYVKRAIRVVELGALHTWGSILPAVFVTETYAGQVKTESVKGDLAQIEARWMRAASDVDRTRVARDAELLADRVEENLPGAPADWQRTNLYQGEAGARDRRNQLRRRGERAGRRLWSWFKKEAASVASEARSIGKLILVGGGVLSTGAGVDATGQRGA